MSDIATLTQALIRFRDERDWKQFHTLKDLILSLNLEAAELLELMQWKTNEQVATLKSEPEFQENLKDECADVFLYLLLIAEEAGIDLIAAAENKLKKNAAKYPADQFYGSAQKYTEHK